MVKWSEEAKKESDNPFVLSLFFPAVPSYFEVWQTLSTFAGRNVRWSAKQKGITNTTTI